MIKLLRSYFFWTYDRGSLHYDIMVSLILVFIFFSPKFIDYRDRPVPDLPPHNSELMIEDNGPVPGGHEFIYRVRTGHLTGDLGTDAGLHAALQNAVDSLAGPARIERYTPVTDAHGSIVAYSVWVVR